MSKLFLLISMKHCHYKKRDGAVDYSTAKPYQKE